MSRDVNKSFDWGILGCGWLGTAWGTRCREAEMSAWGSARRPEALSRLDEIGIVPIAFDSRAESNQPWPSCRHLLVSLSPSAGRRAFEQAAIQAEHVEWTVLISSTSVYPDGDGAFIESDAVRRKSPHSGMCLLDLESLFDPANTTILRAGGLFGPGRHPGGFLQGRTLSRPDDPINVVHLDDVLGAVGQAKRLMLHGPFNLTAPDDRSRSAFYGAAGAVPGPAGKALRTEGRRILSDRIIEQGFTFLHPDPVKAVSLMSKSSP